MPKNSPYKRILSRKLLQLIEAGTLDLIMSRWERGGMLDCGPTGADTSLVEPLGHGKCNEQRIFRFWDSGQHVQANQLLFFQKS